MKKVTELIQEIVSMGFTREAALHGINATLNSLKPHREELHKEAISNNLYFIIIYGFKEKIEARTL